MITYFHRNLKAGFSINKVTQTVVSGMNTKEEYYMPHAGASVNVLFENLLYVYRHRNKSGLNHVTGDVHYVIMALIGCKSVLTIHDTFLLDFNKLSLLKRLVVEWFWFRIPLKLATKVVCISEHTKQSVEKYTKRNDIVVIHNAVDPSFKNEEKVLTAKTINVLLIGTNPNKNLERTFEALKGLDCIVTIIGKLTQIQEKILTSNNVKFDIKMNLSDSEMIEEYKKTDIVSFISLYEGFGMPIIEANKIGRAVITSDIPVLHEVAGDSAVFVNPYDVEDMKNGFIRLFSDDALRKECIERGFKNVQRFDVNVIRKKWNQLYKTL